MWTVPGPSRPYTASQCILRCTQRHSLILSRRAPCKVCCSCQSEQHATRRSLLAVGSVAALLAQTAGQPHIAFALGFKKELKRKKIPLEEYTAVDNGSKIYDLLPGSGPPVTEGAKVKVHFDCMYKGIDVASSRYARLLGGNRTVAEPLEFTAGKPVRVEDLKDVDRAGGLFSGQSGPKPPPVLSSAVVGMRRGGKRSVIVPPELGYGQEGLQEIPPGGTFELQIEILS